MFYLDAQKKINESDSLSKEEIQDSQLVITENPDAAAANSASSKSRRRKKKN
jgi:hypothetical protein